jgi:3-hydroxybutyrate dehydrogenase
MNDSASLAGKSALVTGSVQGIGLAIARCLARAGVRIAVHGIASREAGEAVAAELVASGAAAACFHDADLRDVAAIEAMMAELAEWGPLDVLVNNAGIQKTAPIAEVDPATWDAILAVNLSAAFHTMRHALPIMATRGYGRVVNIASVHGLVASKSKAPYVAAKTGLVVLSRVAALEYADCGDRRSGGVTVNCVCPGWTSTELIEPQIVERQSALGVDRDGAIAELLAEKQPSLRLSDPSEIGELVLWLCQPVAHNMTGDSIPLDGGWTAQ